MSSTLRRGWKTHRRSPDSPEPTAASLIDSHIGREAIVFGNGPSYSQHPPHVVSDFIGCRDLVTIGVNRMWECWGDGTASIPCQYVVILDATFLRRNSRQIRDYWEAYNPTFIFPFRPPTDQYKYQNISISAINKPERKPKYRKGMIFHSGSGGCAAVQLAMHMGVNRIFMLGHDGCPAENGDSHGFGMRAAKDLGYRQGARHLTGYEYLPTWAGQRNVELLNLSQASLIRSIAKTTLEEACALPVRNTVDRHGEAASEAG